MRILYLITRADRAGAQLHLVDLINGFAGEVEPIVGVGEEGFLTEYLRSKGVPCYVLRNLVHPISPLKDLCAVGNVWSLIRCTRPACVHSHTAKAGTVGRIAAILARTPSVYTVHSWCFDRGRSWKWRIFGGLSERLLEPYTDRIVNVSEATRHLARLQGMRCGRNMISIHNGLSDTPFRANPGERSEPIVLMAARFAPFKDQSLLVRALARAKIPVRIWFAGDGPSRAVVEELGRSLGVADRLSFLGERRDIPELMSKSHIFALASFSEAFPLTILEAMRAGLPVVATDVGGVREAVEDGKTGYLVRVRDEQHLAERLTSLTVDPGLRMRMGAAGRRTYEEKFTLGAMIGSLRSVYREVSSERSRVPQTTMEILQQ
jgi:glycosyltransferase involved in cell wall biosynthesis